ncbi:MAG: TIGR01212 family radical SAM protein [Deltaproteobacteria bacterium]|nr:TIGR01212 family radical SAM protein [Deltaproteobacteria bacterium]
MSKPDFWNNTKRYYDFKSFLVNTFGCRVHKLQIDAGFTCPNRDGKIATGGCIYCDGRGSRLRQEGPLPSVGEQIVRAKHLFRRLRGAEKFIAYFQTFTNTYAPYETLKELYDEALRQEDIIGLAVGTRPDSISDDVIELFSEYAQDSHVWLEYGLQSAHDRTLEFINRGHNLQTLTDTVTKTAGRNIHICTHIIVGLPGESHDDILGTARFVASLPIQGIKIHLLLALEGTELGVLYKAGKVEMIGMEDYVNTVCDILEILPPEMVIQRLTADGYRDIYLAPEWGKSKLTVINAIDRELERRDSHQGINFDR